MQQKGDCGEGLLMPSRESRPCAGPKREGPVISPDGGSQRKLGATQVIPGVSGSRRSGIWLTVGLMGMTKSLLVDTGSCISILKEPIEGVLVEEYRENPYDVNGNQLRELRLQHLVIQVGSFQIRHPFIISPISIPGDGLLGEDLIAELGMTICAAPRRITIDPRWRTRTTQRTTQLWRGLAWVGGSDVGTGNIGEVPVDIITDEVPETPRPRAETRKMASWGGQTGEASWEVRNDEAETLASQARRRGAANLPLGMARSGTRLEVDWEEKANALHPNRVAVRTVASITIPAYSEQLVLARAAEALEGATLFEPKAPHQHGLRVARSVHRLHGREIPVKVANLTAGAVHINKAQHIGDVEVVDEHLIEVPEPRRSTSSVPEGNIKKELEQKLKHLPPRERAVLREVLWRHWAIFGEPDGRGCSLPVYHRIETGDARPVIKRPYRVPHHHKAVVKEHLTDMLKKGIIRPSNSPWQAPVVLVPKKTDGSETQWRFCTDFRGLNAVTKTDAYPLPLITETLEQLGRSKYFTTIDLASGYHQIAVAPEDQEKTAFTTEGGHFEYQRMAFGLVNAPATFQRLMDRLLADVKGTECLVYLDDVLVISATLEEHRDRLDRILGMLESANLKIKLKKCAFAQREVKYLGHVVTADGVKPDPSKLEAIRNYPIPKGVRDVRGFLGLAGYYRRFIADYADLAKPLTELLKRDTRFRWDAPEQAAFERLQEALCHPPVLIYPDFGDEFILATDASDVAVGAILSQVRDGYERPVAFASRQLQSAERNYSVTEKELLAVVWATKQFRCYLLGRKFKLLTDHAALRWMLSLKDPSSRLTRWALRLGEFQYEVEHKPGRKHTNADALSRAVAPVRREEELVDLEELKEAQASDVECGRLRLADEGKATEIDGVLYYRDRFGRNKIYVPRGLRTKAIRQCHDTPWAGHPGRKRTKARVERQYYWPGLSKEVTNYVKSCVSCAQRKAPAGLAVPVTGTFQPERPFQMVSMDIVGPLPVTPRGNRYLLTCIDHFSRYAEGIPLREQTAEDTARAFVENIILRHGVPERILTDQGRNFTSELFQGVCRLLQIKKLQTTPYHPECNGMVERLHRTLVDSLAHYVKRDGRDWDRWVPYALSAYRSTPHATTGYTPNYLVWGREIDQPGEHPLPEPEERLPEMAPLEALQTRLREAHKVAREVAAREQETRTNQRNKGRKHRSFRVGDLVYLHQPAVPSGQAKKFYRPWTGPMTVVKELPPVNYVVEKPNGEVVTVHVNRLKPCYTRPEMDTRRRASTVPPRANGRNKVKPRVTNQGTEPGPSIAQGGEYPSGYQTPPEHAEWVECENETGMENSSRTGEESVEFRAGETSGRREDSEEETVVEPDLPEASEVDHDGVAESELVVSRPASEVGISHADSSSSSDEPDDPKDRTWKPEISIGDVSRRDLERLRPREARPEGGDDIPENPFEWVSVRPRRRARRSM